ncbi:hypothetical protein MG293_020739 [Ovis ammon polii]|uniref:Uncharacterized protein n=1 Tax=Ovis ammon polii TaxID=230172 RepID=A0AAD4TM87_OVIAM|nr:hypothetical protein MG293_020739 [Ovis ammon polii]
MTCTPEMAATSLAPSWVPPSPGGCPPSGVPPNSVLRPHPIKPWLPPGDDGSVSPARAHLKCQGAASSLLSCRAREGLGPEREDWGAARARRPGAGSPVAREPASSEQGGPDQSPDGDSSSDYVNNTSEEKDYDSGLPEEEEGITYFIRYCPEDDSSLQGRDCEGRGYPAHDAHHLEMDERQEAVQEWTEPGPSDSPQGLPTH